MNLENEMLGIPSGDSLIDLNRNIFNLINSGVTDIEDLGYIDNSEKLNELTNTFYDLTNQLNYEDMDNIKNYFERLLNIDKVISMSVMYSGLDIVSLEQNTEKLLTLHLELQSNILKHTILNLNKPLFDRNINSELIDMKHIFKNDSFDSILSEEISELINDIDRTTYSNSIYEYKNNKKRRIKTKTIV